MTDYIFDYRQLSCQLKLTNPFTKVYGSISIKKYKIHSVINLVSELRCRGLTNLTSCVIGQTESYEISQTIDDTTEDRYSESDTCLIDRMSLL